MRLPEPTGWARGICHSTPPALQLFLTKGNLIHLRGTAVQGVHHSGSRQTRPFDQGAIEVNLVRRAHEFEYRDGKGIDRLGQADLWASTGGEHAVLVLRNVDGGLGGNQRLTLLENARRALYMLASSLLPFLVPQARLDVWVLRPGDEKPRALVLP